MGYFGAQMITEELKEDKKYTIERIKEEKSIKNRIGEVSTEGDLINFLRINSGLHEEFEERRKGRSVSKAQHKYLEDKLK